MSERRESSPELERRLMELQSLFEASQILNSSLTLSTILDALLLTAMGRFLITRGLVALLRNGELLVERVKGDENVAPGTRIGEDVAINAPTLLKAGVPPPLSLLQRHGYALMIPLVSARRRLGLVAFGRKGTGEPFATREVEFLETLCRIGATAIENALVVEQLDQTNRRLDRKLQEMSTLLELSRELNSSLDEKQTAAALSYALMGEMLTNRCCVWLLDGGKVRALSVFGQDDSCATGREDQLVDYLRALDGPVCLDDDGHPTAADLRNLGYGVVVPLRTQERTVGAFALGERLDRRPYSDEDLAFLDTVANHAANALENARLFRESLEKQRLEEELKIAREIQLRLLPQEFPRSSSVDIWGIHKPSRWVAGDSFDVLEMSERELAFMIADVSGKGVPASLLMANVQAGFRTLIAPGAELAEVASRMNRLVYQSTDFDKFVTAFIAVLDRQTGHLRYVNAGHNPPYLVRADGAVETLQEGGLLLGMMPDVPYVVGETQMRPGDLLLLFTDGVVEAQDPEENEFHETRLLNLLAQCVGASAREVCERVLQAVEAFAAGRDQYDDITLLAVRYPSEE